MSFNRYGTNYRHRFTVSPERRQQRDGDACGDANSASFRRAATVAPSSFRRRRHRWSELLNRDEGGEGEDGNDSGYVHSYYDNNSSRVRLVGEDVSGGGGGSGRGREILSRRRYAAFDPAEWKLQRCQKRLANLDMESAFDRAQERHRNSTNKWASKAEEESTVKDTAAKKKDHEFETKPIEKSKKNINFEMTPRKGPSPGPDWEKWTAKSVPRKESATESSMSVDRPQFGEFLERKGGDGAKRAEIEERAKLGGGGEEERQAVAGVDQRGEIGEGDTLLKGREANGRISRTESNYPESVGEDSLLTSSTNDGGTVSSAGDMDTKLITYYEDKATKAALELSTKVKEEEKAAAEIERRRKEEEENCREILAPERPGPKTENAKVEEDRRTDSSADGESSGTDSTTKMHFPGADSDGGRQSDTAGGKGREESKENGKAVEKRRSNPKEVEKNARNEKKEEGSDGGLTWTDCSSEVRDGEKREEAVKVNGEEAPIETSALELSLTDGANAREAEGQEGQTDSKAVELDSSANKEGVNGVAGSEEETYCTKAKRKNSQLFKVSEPKEDYKKPLLRLAKPAAPKSRDLSWLEDKSEDLLLDSMHATLKKWIEQSSEWGPGGDPLENVKGKSATSTFVGTKATDPYVRLRDEVYSYRGERDFYGKPHGRGVATFENGDQLTGEFRSGSREGRGSLRVARGDVMYLDGIYVRDRLEGKGKIEYRNGDVLCAWFSAGTLHGFGKLFSRQRRLKQLCWYSNGVPSGTVWQFTEGGGCLVGEADHMGNLIGDGIAFLFPDLQTALMGTFVKGQMVLAQICFIQLVAVRNEVCQLKFTQPRGPIYEFDPGTHDRISRNPLLPDPFETQYCYVRNSKIKGAQEGLFAKKSLPKDFVVSFYNGVRLEGEEVEENKEDWEANAYKILDLRGKNEETGLEGVLDIPPEFVSTKRYQASLAHKANHSFQPNGRFVLFHHPRFGPVPAIITTAEIDKDCEITVSYDYSMDDAPPWYQELFAKRIIDQYRQSKEWNF